MSPIKGVSPEQSSKLTIIHPSYHMSTYLRAHQQAYLIRGMECMGQEVTDVKGSEYLLAQLSSTCSYNSTHSTHTFPYIVLCSILTIHLGNHILRYTLYYHKRKFPLASFDRRCHHKAINQNANLFYILSEYLNTFVGLK